MTLSLCLSLPPSPSLPPSLSLSLSLSSAAPLSLSTVCHPIGPTTATQFWIQAGSRAPASSLSLSLVTVTHFSVQPSFSRTHPPFPIFLVYISLLLFHFLFMSRLRSCRVISLTHTCISGSFLL